MYLSISPRLPSRKITPMVMSTTGPASERRGAMGGCGGAGGTGGGGVIVELAMGHLVSRSLGAGRRRNRGRVRLGRCGLHALQDDRDTDGDQQDRPGAVESVP